MKKLYGKAVAILLVAVMMITSTKWDVLYASAENQTGTAMDEVAEQFDAYYLETANETGVMAKVKVEDKWTMNDKGFIAASKDSVGGVESDVKDVDVLTWKERPYTDFELTYTFQTGWDRIGIIFGTAEGQFPIKKTEQGLEAADGVMFFLSREGHRGGWSESLKNDEGNGFFYEANEISGFKDSPEHTLKIVVRERKFYAYVDGSTEPVQTLDLPETYKGGYVSFFSATDNHAGMKDFTITDRNTVDKVAEQFDAYYLADASVTSDMVSAEVKERWTMNDKGFISARKDTAGQDTGNETKNVDVLTFKGQEYTDFELTYTFQQASDRIGIIFGTKAGEFPIKKTEQGLEAAGGVMFYLSAEGHRAAWAESLKKDNYDNGRNGFTYDGSAISSFMEDDPWNMAPWGNVNETRKEHTMKIVVREKTFYAYVDGSVDPVMTLTLPETYEGGYVSFFSVSNENWGMKDFTITDRNTVDKVAEQFDAYYLADASVTSDMVSAEVKERWTMNDKGFISARKDTAGQDTGNETKNVDVLTFKGQEYTDFELTYTFQQASDRIGIIFGTKAGEFPIKKTEQGLEAAGGVMFYLSAEGHRAAWAESLKKDNYDNGKNGFTYDGSAILSFMEDDPWNMAPWGNVGVRKEHTMKIVVMGNEFNAYVDDGAEPVMTLTLPDTYEGGYVSLFSVSNVNYGIKDVTISDRNMINKVEEQFDAYYLADASETMEMVNLKEHWLVNSRGFTSAKKDTTGQDTSNETKNVDVLTWKEKAYTDFELTYTFQQAYDRIGIIFGTKAGQFPLKRTEQGLEAAGGVMFYLEAEGTPDAMGEFIDGYTDKENVRRRLGDVKLEGFMDGDNPPWGNVGDRKEHTMKIVVKDKAFYAYVDDSAEPVMTLTLPDTYEGGYVSFFSVSNKNYGMKDFTISEEIATDVPGTPLNKLTEQFDAYYLADASETMERVNLKEHWLVNSRGFTSARKDVTDEEGCDETRNVDVLTWKERAYTDFELTFTFQQAYHRIGIIFGTEAGQFPLKRTEQGLEATGGVMFYLEAEGVPDAMGEFLDGYTDERNVRRRLGDLRLAGFMDGDNPPWGNVGDRKEHTMKIVVKENEFYAYVDDSAEPVMTLTLPDTYEGGYVSVFSASNENYGVKDFTISDKVDTVVPGTPLNKLTEQFDAYYLEDAGKSTAMQKTVLAKNWFYNDKGYLARYKKAEGTETKDVDVLTYKVQKYTDFELTYTYQQNWHRTGVIFGTEAGQFPLQVTDNGVEAAGGVMFFLEAEGTPNTMGDIASGYNIENEARQRLSADKLTGFTDENGSPLDNCSNKVTHQVKLVVKDREMYVFIDGSSDYDMYVKLPESYNGGYISIFSCSTKDAGFGSIDISETITTALPGHTQIERYGNDMSVRFDSQNLDMSCFDSYYLSELDDKGSMVKTDFYDHWMIANDCLMRGVNEGDSDDYYDAADVAVLTYNEHQYTDFVATFEYQKTQARLMLLFGGKNGSYPLCLTDSGKQGENGGVIVYPENDLGGGGGMCALGQVGISYQEDRPICRDLPYAPGYCKEGDWFSNDGKTYTMTVAVINKHCYIYIEGFGMIMDFDLTDDYSGGYISLASTAILNHGFKSLSIREVNAADANVITDVEELRAITVKTGTALAELSLPSTVKVTTGDGTKRDADVMWTDCGYDGNTEGNYRFVGTIFGNGITNPGCVAAVLDVKVRDSIPGSNSATKIWTFDTRSDLMDFESFFVKDAKEGGAVKSSFPKWYVNSGKLCLDRYRGENSYDTENVRILTYTGKKYKNFEAQIEFSQQWERTMILFGSQTPGQYIDFANPKAETNPVAVYSEIEGRRTAIGNVFNVQFGNKAEDAVSMIRELSSG